MTLTLRIKGLYDPETSDVWAWWEGCEGHGYRLYPCSFGLECRIEVPGDIARMGFILRKNCSNPGEDFWGTADKDFPSDRFAALDGQDACIYLVWGDPRQYTSTDGGQTLTEIKFFTLAGIVSCDRIRCHVSPYIVPEAGAVEVTEGGRKMRIKAVVPAGTGSSDFDILLETDMRVGRKHRVIIYGYGERDAVLTDIFSAPVFTEKYIYTGKDLGAVVKGDRTIFKLWAPTALSVTLNLFRKGNGCDAFSAVRMKKTRKGVWKADIPCKSGTYYTYSVETVSGIRETWDPYARACGVNGDRSMVVDLRSTNPEGFDADRPVKCCSYGDAVIWEVHVRDFSNGIKNSKYRGRYLAFTERGLENSSGVPAGLDYLKQLGITHVHLMPVFDYATVDEAVYKNVDETVNKAVNKSVNETVNETFSDRAYKTGNINVGTALNNDINKLVNENINKFSDTSAYKPVDEPTDENFDNTCDTNIYKTGNGYFDNPSDANFYNTGGETGVSEGSGFNWGYDPKNYNVPEGSYSTDPYHGEVRIREFKQMVMALHGAGIGVILDVVYNHTWSADGCFGSTVPYYYYRYRPDGTMSNGSGCGNETASERFMFRKYMLDSVEYWINEYHVDGFRFDLMAVHDIETMQLVEEKVHSLNPCAVIYGEGWSGGSVELPAPRQASLYNINSIHASGKAAGSVAVFNDCIRDGLKGDAFSSTSRGYINGCADAEHTRKTAFGITGGSRAFSTGWSVNSSMVVNYMSSHDNFTLWDKLRASNPNIPLPELVGMNRLGICILMLSRGTVFMQAGEEMLRTKHGNGNSYCSPDSINNLDWESLKPGSPQYETMLFYAALIKLRSRSDFLKDADISCNILENNVIEVRYVKDGELAGTALVNPHNSAFLYSLPCGKWKLLIDGTEVVESGKTVSGSVRVEQKGVLLAQKI